VDLLNYV